MKRATVFTRDKAHDAELARRIEAEYPPGQARPRQADASLPPTLGEHFGLRAVVEELRRIREVQGVSLDDLRERTGLDLAALEQIENAPDPNPSVNALARYARALGRRLVISLDRPAPA